MRSSLACKYSDILTLCMLTDSIDRVDNDDALRAKVNEALSVYKDYMETRGEGNAGPNGEELPGNEGQSEAIQT